MLYRIQKPLTHRAILFIFGLTTATMCCHSVAEQVTGDSDKMSHIKKNSQENTIAEEQRATFSISPLLELTADNFDNTIANSTPTLVIFGADWADPAKRMLPELKKLSILFEGNVVFATLDVERENEIPKRYNVRGIPAIILFKDGEIILTKVGSMNFEHMKQTIESHLEIVPK